MDSHKQIWNLAKLRFLQGEASLWVFSNKTIDVIGIFGLAIWFYFEFFVDTHGLTPVALERKTSNSVEYGLYPLSLETQRIF